MVEVLTAWHSEDGQETVTLPGSWFLLRNEIKVVFVNA